MFKTIMRKALKEETGYAFQPGSHFYFNGKRIKHNG